MAVMAFELADFEKAGYGKDRLIQLIPQLGVEIERIDESVVSVNVTPNRPDLLDFIGLMRALNNFSKKRVPEEGFYSIRNDPELSITVGSGVRGVRPYIAGIIAKNVDLSGNMLKYAINFTEKFADTYGRKRRKLAIGMHSLDAVDGDLVYDAANSGNIVPLGDKEGMEFNEVMKKNEKGVEYGDTIHGLGSGKEVYPFLRDSKKVIALIPITNCEETRVTERTKSVFVDITGTSNMAVRNAAAVIASSFLYAKADVYPVVVKDRGSEEAVPVLELRKIRVSTRNMDRTLGIEAGRHDIIALGNRMGYVAAKYGNSVEFHVPPYRVDVLNEQDIIEDVAIAFGYDNIAPLPIVGYVDGLADEVSEFENRIAMLMVGLGYTEAINSSLTNEAANFTKLMHMQAEGSYVSIADAKTMNVTMLRTTLLPGLLQNLGTSITERLPQRLFEIGRAYAMENGKLRESVNLCAASEHARANFAEMRAAVDAVIAGVGVGEHTIGEHSDSAFIDGRCGRIEKGGETIGIFGELHPQVLRNFGIEEPVVALELKLVREIKYKV